MAKEGLNATVGGSNIAIKLYVDAVISHPLFCDMNHENFKVRMIYMSFTVGAQHHVWRGVLKVFLSLFF